MTLKKDIIGAEVQIGTNQAQAELVKLSKETAQYRNENERLLLLMKKLEVAGKKNSDEWKNLKKQYDANKVAIKDNQLRTEEYTKKLGLTSLTMKQLRTRMTELRRQLSNTVPNTAEWDKYNKELQETQARYRQLSNGSRQASGFMGTLTKSAGALLPALGVTAVVAGLKRIASGVWNINENIEAVNQKARIVFGNSFSDMADAAEENAKRLNLTVTQYLKAAAGTADLLVPIQFTREESAKMSKELVNLSGALSEWSGGQYDATEASYIATKALLGETEQLKQMGIVIDQSSKEYNTRIKLLQEDQHYTAQQAKAIDIFNQIMQKSTDAQASFNEEGLKFLRTRRSWSTFWQQTKEDLGEWAGYVGKSLLYTGDKIKLFFRDLKSWANDHLDWLGVSFDVEPLEKYSAALIYGKKEMNYYADTVERFGTSSEKGKAALTLMRIELEKTYGAEGLKIFEDYKAEMEALTAAREASAEKERKAIEEQRKAAVDAASNKELLVELEKVNQERLNMIKQQYLAQELTDDEYKTRTLASELAYLQLKKTYLEQSGEDTIDVETQIYDKRIQLAQQKMAVIEKIYKEFGDQVDEYMNERQKQLDNDVDATIKYGKDVVDETDKLKKQEADALNERANAYLNLATSVGDSFEDMLINQEVSFGQFLKNTLVMALDALEKILVMSIAEATIKDIGTLGPLGLLKAAGEIIAMKAAFAVAKAAVLGGSKRSGGYGETAPSDNQVMGVYHANEFIANADAVRNPSIRRVLDVIDLAQRSGTVSALNLPAIINAGRQSGGYANPTPTTLTNENLSPFPRGTSEAEGVSDSTAQALTAAIYAFMNHRPEVAISDIDKKLNNMKTRNSKIWM